MKSKSQKNIQQLKNKSPPGYTSEIAFLMINLFILKFYSERFFDAMSFFNISIPIMLYLVGCLIINLLDFVKQMHIDEMTGSPVEEDENSNESSIFDQIISPVQVKLLNRIVRDLCAYFGVYYLSSQIDTVFALKEDRLDKLHLNLQFKISIVLIELALVTQILIVRYKRSEILKA